MEAEGRMPCHVGKLHASEDTVWLQPVTCGGNIAHAEEQPKEDKADERLACADQR